MDQRSETHLLVLTAQALRFASDHPYAATGIFGAAVGSVVTYRVMTYNSLRQKATKVFTPKVYEFALPAQDLRRMLDDPSYEMRWDIPELTVVVTAEKREPMKALPDTLDGEVL
ncbi:MAG: hypothetical protein ACJ8BW_01970 [Ktedonobacteraceae bacterium]|jgi:hypothetical protein